MISAVLIRGRFVINFRLFGESNFQQAHYLCCFSRNHSTTQFSETQTELELFRESSSFRVFFWNWASSLIWNASYRCLPPPGTRVILMLLYWTSSLPTSDGILPSWCFMSRHEVCYDEWMATFQIYWFGREIGTTVSWSHDLDGGIMNSRLLFCEVMTGWVYHEFETAVSWSHDLDGCIMNIETVVSWSHDLDWCIMNSRLLFREVMTWMGVSWIRDCCFVKSWLGLVYHEVKLFLKSSFFKEIPFISLQVPLSFKSHLRFWFLLLQTSPF